MNANKKGIDAYRRSMQPIKKSGSEPQPVEAPVAPDTSFIKDGYAEDAPAAPDAPVSLKRRNKTGSERERRIRSGRIPAEAADRYERRYVEEKVAPIVSFVRDLPLPQSLMVLRKESAAVKSVVIPFLKPKIAARMLSQMDAEERTAVVKRIARMERVPAETIRTVVENLRRRLRFLSGIEYGAQLNGTDRLVRILVEMDEQSEARMVENLSRSDRILARKIQRRILNSVKYRLKESVRDETDARRIAEYLCGPGGMREDPAESSHALDASRARLRKIAGECIRIVDESNPMIRNRHMERRDARKLMRDLQKTAAELNR